MAYTYKKTKRTIIMGADPGEKFLLAMAHEGKVSTEMLCEFIIDRKSVV